MIGTGMAHLELLSQAGAGDTGLVEGAVDQTAGGIEDPLPEERRGRQARDEWGEVRRTEDDGAGEPAVQAQRHLIPCMCKGIDVNYGQRAAPDGRQYFGP